MESCGFLLMNKMLFSFVVPVYNVEMYLGRCVDSLIVQEEQGIEIILVDDGSTDGSGELCDKYADKYPCVSVIHKENGGLSSARNAGIERAKGDYLIFVDSDDYVEKDICKTLAEVIRQTKAAEVIGYNGFEEWEGVRESVRNRPVQKLELMSGRDYLYSRYRHRSMCVQSWLYCCKREFLNREGLRFREGILHEDVEFTPRMLLKAKSVAETPAQLYHYIVRESSISMRKNREKNIKDLYTVLKGQCKIAETLDQDLEKWMKNAALNSYLNMIQEARMYKPQYRKYLNKRFLWGKAATPWNHIRVMLCTVNVRWYCAMNDLYKSVRKRT